MLQKRYVAPALSLVLLLGACSTRSDRSAALPDDLKQDLAAAAASSGELAPATQPYQPMRFVSSVERAHAAAPARRTTVARRPVKAKHSRQPAPEVASETPDPTSAMVAEAPAPVSTPDAATTEPVVVTRQPEPAPTPAPSSAGSGGEIGTGERGHGGAWGGILGGLIGAAVIRGGVGTVDKCDPRTDGRMRPPIIGRPDFGMPVPTGQPTFPRSRRRW